MYTPRTILLLLQQDGKSIQESNESILTFTLATALISCSNGVSDELTQLAEAQVKTIKIRKYGTNTTKSGYRPSVVALHSTNLQLRYDECLGHTRGADKSLARPTSRCILFDGENISFDASLVMYINSTNIPPIMIINRIYEH
jgi:hypothetical protein